MLVWLVFSVVILSVQPPEQPATPIEPWLFYAPEGIWLVVPDAWLAGADSIELRLLEQGRYGLGFTHADRCPYGSSSVAMRSVDTVVVVTDDDWSLLLCGLGSGERREVALSATRFTASGIRRSVVRASAAIRDDSTGDGAVFASLVPLLGAVVGALLTYGITHAQRQSETKQKKIALAREVWDTIDRDLRTTLTRLATFLHHPVNVPAPLPEDPWTVLTGRSDLYEYLLLHRGREYVDRLLRFYDDNRFREFQQKTRECSKLKRNDRRACLEALVQPALDMEQDLRDIIASRKEN